MSGSGDTVSYRYDADRERVGAIAPDPDGAGSLVRAATRNTYDSRGRVYIAATGTVAGTSDSDWASFSEAYRLYSQYDERGLVIRQTIWSAGVDYAVSDYLYDAVGRRTCAIQYMDPAQWGPQATSCGPLQTNGPAGPDRAVRTTYDDAGRVTKVQTAYGIAGVQSDDATTAYTANGQVADVTDAEGNKTTYEYDAFDRLKKTFYPVTTKGALTSNTGSSGDYEELAYDRNGNVTSRRLRDGTSIAYTYDTLNRVTDKNLPSPELDVAYTYNLLGQPLTAATSAQTVTLAYDALGRLTSQATATGTVGYEYDLAGRRTKLTWPDTFYVTYDYDTAGNLKAIKESGTTTLASFDYDSLGRRTTLTRGNGVATSYTFDNASRLTQLVSNPTGTSYDLTIDLSYTASGQIKSRTASNDAYAWTGAANVTRAYTANGLNQFTASGATSLTYDARGNLNASGSDSYTYSSENLLTSATVGSVTTSLTYDPLMRLYEIGTSGGMKLVYDGTAIIGSSNGTTLGRRYVTVPGTDEVISEYKISNGTRDYKLTDERGSVIATTDASGNASGINAYDEYGLPNAAGNSMRFQYTGQFYISEIGLYYYKARMYSPSLGRFMQTDPIGYGDGMNWYNYVGSDPINWSDPSGLLGDTVIKDKQTCIDRGDCSTLRSFDVIGVPFRPGIDGNSDGEADIVVSATRPKLKPPAPGKAPEKPAQPCAYRNASGQCVYVTDQDGKLQFDPEYARQACVRYKAMMRSNRQVAGAAGATNLPAGANVMTGGSFGVLRGLSRFLSLPGFIFMRGMTYITTGAIAAGATPPPGCH